MATTATTLTKPASKDRMALETQMARETETTEMAKMEEEDETHQTPPPATTEEARTTHLRADEKEEPTTILDIL
ncbi:hypothetical protein A2U01_0067478, partial [Trifolium medium]|nr:hypothetical protein [Trifolium medium]